MDSIERAETILRARRSQDRDALLRSLEAAAGGGPTGCEEEDERRELLQTVAGRMRALLDGAGGGEPGSPQWETCCDLLTHLSRARVRATVR